MIICDPLKEPVRVLPTGLVIEENDKIFPPVKVTTSKLGIVGLIGVFPPENDERVLLLFPVLRTGLFPELKTPELDGVFPPEREMIGVPAGFVPAAL